MLRITERTCDDTLNSENCSLLKGKGYFSREIFQERKKVNKLLVCEEHDRKQKFFVKVFQFKNLFL